jgi:hypothetical protein
MDEVSLRPTTKSSKHFYGLFDWQGPAPSGKGSSNDEQVQTAYREYVGVLRNAHKFGVRGRPASGVGAGGVSIGTGGIRIGAGGIRICGATARLLLWRERYNGEAGDLARSDRGRRRCLGDPRR